MTEVPSVTGGASNAVSAAGDGDARACRVSFGGVGMSATDAAEFVMMHRTEVLKQVGADRTELAEKHLADIRKARQYINDLTDMRKFGEDRGDRGCVPTTPEMVDYLKNEVGCSPGEYRQRVIFCGSAVSKLPVSIRNHYGLHFDRSGKFKPQTGGKFDLWWVGDSKHKKLQIHGALVLNKDDIDTIKEEMNNYVDQLTDSNNLFMTKFKNVVNTMNETLDGASSMVDKSHDTVKNLVSRW